MTSLSVAVVGAAYQAPSLVTQEARRGRPNGAFSGDSVREKVVEGAYL